MKTYDFNLEACQIELQKIKEEFICMISENDIYMKVIISQIKLNSKYYEENEKCSSLYDSIELYLNWILSDNKQRILFLSIITDRINYCFKYNQKNLSEVYSNTKNHDKSNFVIDDDNLINNIIIKMTICGIDKRIYTKLNELTSHSNSSFYTICNKIKQRKVSLNWILRYDYEPLITIVVLVETIKFVETFICKLSSQNINEEKEEIDKVIDFTIKNKSSLKPTYKITLSSMLNIYKIADTEKDLQNKLHALINSTGKNLNSVLTKRSKLEEQIQIKYQTTDTDTNRQLLKNLKILGDELKIFSSSTYNLLADNLKPVGNTDVLSSNEEKLNELRNKLNILFEFMKKYQIIFSSHEKLIN